jgi:hypothetical protein
MFIVFLPPIYIFLLSTPLLFCILDANPEHLSRIWPISLSLTLPPSVQLSGFDITDAQFPPREWLPPNVRLEKLDILAPIPEELTGRYDVVVIRFFSLMVKDNDIGTLLANLLSLLSERTHPFSIESWSE